MIKRNPILLLLILLLNLAFYFNVSTATTQNYIPRKYDFDRSGVPKNILLGSYAGGRSHVKPMLDVAIILIERGYNVTLVAAGRYEPSSEYPGLNQVTLGLPELTAKTVKKHDSHKEFTYKELTNVMELAIRDYKKIYEKYKKVAKDYNIDLFICDFLANEACIDAANSLKKPVIVWTSFLQFVDSTPYKSDPMYGCNVSLENESFFERFRCALIQPLQIANTFGPFERELNNIRKQMDKKTVLGAPKISLALIDTFFGFELPQHLAPNIQEIGPVLPEEYPPLTPELSNFINAHERVLYAAFGTRFFTTTENNNKILQSLVEAVNKKIVDGVVWPLVETSRDNFYPTLNLTDGTQVPTLPILNNKHPHIHITKFAPQFAVLNHTNTKLFFSHGGAGSVHESLYTGTPMLVLPFGADQTGNGRKLKSAGVALTTSVLNLDVNDVLNKMSILLEDEKVKKNSKRMEVLTKINSKRKYRAADLVEYILHSRGLNEHVNDDFLKEWEPAGTRMGFIKANNLDVYAALLGIVLTVIGGIAFKLTRYASNPLSIKMKSKKA